MPKTIQALPVASATYFSGVSQVVDDPWELTRRVSPRPDVRTMVREADGLVHANLYPRLFRVGPVAPGVPWCVRLADGNGLYRLLCFDFDAKEESGREAAQDDADALVLLLVELRVEFVLCESSSGGGRHVWVGLGEGVPAETVALLARAAKANFSTLDYGMLLNPKEGSARPPGSPHRNGSVSRVLRGSTAVLLAPTTRLTQVVALTSMLSLQAPPPRPSLSVPGGPVVRGHQAHRGLTRWGEQQMAILGGGANPSHTGFLCLLAAASSGWSFEDVVQASLTAPGMEHYRSKKDGRGGRRPREDKERLERLERQWATAEQRATLHEVLPRNETPPDLDELGRIVGSVSEIVERVRVSPGRWGSSESAFSEKTVLLAVAYLTLQTGREVVAASIRDLALVCGLGRTTVSRALQALQVAGFVSQVRPHDGANASEWRLQKSFHRPSDTVRSHHLNNTPPPADLFNRRMILVEELEGQLADQRHDIFTRAGLGHLSGRLYTLFRDHPVLTVETAAMLLGVSTRYTIVIFSRLRGSKLVVKVSGGWGRARRDLRDLGARALGVLGTLSARKASYLEERTVWAWWLAEFETMNQHKRDRQRRTDPTGRQLFQYGKSGERAWPRYPRRDDGMGNYKEARYYVNNGVLDPTSRWQLTG